MNKRRVFDLKNRLSDFAVEIIKLVESLRKTRAGAKSTHDFITIDEGLSEGTTRNKSMANYYNQGQAKT